MESPSKKRSAFPMEQPNKRRNTLPFRVFDEEAGCWLTLNHLIGGSFNGVIEVYQGTYAREHDEQGQEESMNVDSDQTAQEQEESMNVDSDQTAAQEQEESMNVGSDQTLLICSKCTVVAQENSDAFKDLQHRVGINRLVPDHPNILGVHRSFTREGKLYVTFPFLSGGTMRSIVAREFMQSTVSNGMSANYVSVVLRETLKGLAEIHRSGQVHREVSASQILFGEKPEIRLAFSATVNDYDNVMNDITPYTLTSSSKTAACPFLPLSSITKWAAAPEVYNHPESNDAANDPKADIWLLGITALELTYGSFNVSDREDLEMVLNVIQTNQKLPFKPHGERKDGKKRSDVSFYSAYLEHDSSPNIKVTVLPLIFEEVVLKCLAKDPQQRPSADELLQFRNFTEMEIDVEQFYNYLKGGRSFNFDEWLKDLSALTLSN